jgi:hypothetical protein
MASHVSHNDLARLLCQLRSCASARPDPPPAAVNETEKNRTIHVTLQVFKQTRQPQENKSVRVVPTRTLMQTLHIDFKRHDSLFRLVQEATKVPYDLWSQFYSQSGYYPEDKGITGLYWQVEYKPHDLGTAKAWYETIRPEIHYAADYINKWDHDLFSLKKYPTENWLEEVKVDLAYEEGGHQPDLPKHKGTNHDGHKGTNHDGHKGTNHDDETFYDDKKYETFYDDKDYYSDDWDSDDRTGTNHRSQKQDHDD